MILLQLHIVFWNTFYESFVHAVDKPEGLFVLGVFLQVKIKKYQMTLIVTFEVLL